SLRIGGTGGSQNRIEKVPRIQSAISEELEQFAVIFIRSRPRREVNDRACIASVLRRKSGVVDLILRQGINRWLEGDLVLHIVVKVYAVDEPVGGVLALARGGDPERSLAADRSGQEAAAGQHRRPPRRHHH